MKIKQFFLGLIACLAIQGGVTATASDFTPRIIGGTDVANRTTYPFYVALVTAIGQTGDGDFVFTISCGGTYLGDGLVLTAAHCFNSVSNLSGINGSRRVYIAEDRTNVGLLDCNDDCVLTENAASLPEATGSGLVDSDGDPVKDIASGLIVPAADAANNLYQYSKINIHHAYSRSSFENDMALVQISNPPLTFSELPVLDTSGSLNGSYTVIGYGNTTFDDSLDEPTEPFAASANLKEVLLPFVSDSLCDNTYRNFDVNSMICAGFNDGTNKDSCQGDSGGPLFDATTDPMTVVGVVSFGDGCAENFGVYSSTYKLRRWINSARSNIVGELDFPLVKVFDDVRSVLPTSRTYTWKIENTSSSAVELTNFSFANMHSVFSSNGTDCINKTLQAGDDCEVSVTGSFASGTVGTYTGAITFEAGGVPMQMDVRAFASITGSSTSSSSSSSSGGSAGWLVLALASLLAFSRFQALRRPLLAVVAGSALSACATSTSMADASEVIYNPEFSAQEVSFDIRSTGCTSADDLAVSVDGDMVTIERLKKDMCRAAPSLVHITLPLPEANNNWTLKNPVGESSYQEQPILN